MECPRCGGDVTVYRLGSNETVACDDCEYAGIPVEHGSEPQPSESWTAAIERFYDGHRSGEGSDDGGTNGGGEASGPDEEAVGSESGASDDGDSAGSAVEEIDVPGEGAERARQRAAIAALYERLQHDERVTSEELVGLIDAVGYDSAAAFWSRVGHDRLSTLPGVVAPAAEEEEWEFDAAWSEWRAVRD